MAIFQKSYILKSVDSAAYSGASSFQFVKINENNLQDGATFNNPTNIQRFQDFLNLNQKGYYVYQGNACIFRGWLFNSPERCLLSEGFCYDLKPYEEFIAWCETAPDYRRLGAFNYWLGKVRNSTESCIKAYVASDNTASINAFRKSGYVINDIFLHFSIRRIKISLKVKSNGKSSFSLIFGSKIR